MRSIGTRTLRTIAAAFGFATLLLPAACRADGDHVSVFAGAQGDYAAFGFAGAEIALPGSTIGNGLAVRGSLFSGGYDYERNATQIKAGFTGEEFDLMYQFSKNGFFNEFGIGARNANTTLTPYDAFNRRRGDITEIAGTLDGGAVQGPWREDYYGSYGGTLNDYIGRLSLTHAVGRSTRIGIEGGAEGDPTYNINRLGTLVGVRLGNKSELQVGAGLSHEIGRPSTAYGRLSIYRSF